MTKLIILFILLIFFSGCSRLEIDIEDVAPDTMSCNFILSNDGDIWRCLLTNVKSFKDSLFFKPAEDAFISVNYTDNTIEGFVPKVLSRTNEVPSYILDIDNISDIPQQSVCTLQITHPLFPPIFAVDTMPKLPIVNDVNITNLEIVQQSHPDQLGGGLIPQFRVGGNFSFDLQLPIDGPRYYLIEVVCPLINRTILY